MTGKGSIHKYGSRWCKVASNLGAKLSGNAVNRSFNTLASGQFLQACPEILVNCAVEMAREGVAVAGCPPHTFESVVVRTTWLGSDQS